MTRFAKRRRISPFEGGRVTSSVTKRHVPLIWEAMLGTVYARTPDDAPEPDGKRYYDYDYEGAHDVSPTLIAPIIQVKRCSRCTSGAGR